MHKAITSSDTYNYLVYLPESFGSREKWPAILYLHGMGAKGEYLEVLKANGLPGFLEEHSDFPFVVISPQCPLDEEWSPELLYRLLDNVAPEYGIDVDRIYLTGIGDGASAAWRAASLRPERFAAVAPICGGGNPHEACNLRDVPVWVFHGAKDPIVPISEAQGMVLALKLCGGNILYTVYPEADHDSWTATYRNPQLYAWFLEHKRGQFVEPVFDPVAEDLD
ncbi:MAG: prolyl oligopeptidase family serine peptidase [Syntrophobacteraceae bacterium]